MLSNSSLHPHSRLGHLEALEGSRIIERKLEVVANDMANVNTVAFKQQQLTFHEYLVLQADGSQRNAKGETAWNEFSQGPLDETGNPFDFAVNGPGFFVIQTPDGPRYTRAGNFTLDSQNQLVTRDGFQVLGDGAPIVLEDTSGQGVWLSDDGIFFVDGSQVGKIDVVMFDDPESLIQVGENMYRASDKAGTPTPAESRVRQGFLEGSNINAVETMVTLIDLHRAYEAQMKALQTLDEMDGRAVNDLGRPA
ncbi:MAG TPA: flagellar basal-body rod protein FlgF [Thermodesulfobacteriaceae bacterium]|nr:flagellar basal-body rod protein FlgF [Thermodesulfobacteriaceae bacterium]